MTKTGKFAKPKKKINIRNSIAKLGGRPPLFKTAEEMQKVIDEYFDWCDNRAKEIYVAASSSTVMINYPAPYTITGLARRLGMDRQTLINYSKKDKFFGTIRDARLRVQEDIENRLMETRNEKGAMFNLKNNFGWHEKNETDITSGGKPIPAPILGGITKDDGLLTDDSDEETRQTEKKN